MTIFDAKAEIDKLRSLDFTQTQAVEIQADREVADFLLSLNFDSNRNLSHQRASAYKELMANGEWVLSDPLKISSDGKLIDGQHRLKAVPNDVVVPFVILTGQPPKASETYDQGMRRNAIHIAKVRGLEGFHLAHISCLRMMLVFRSSDSMRSSVASPAKMIDILEKYPEIKSAIDLGYKYGSRTFGLRYAPFAAAIARAKISDYPLSDNDLDFFCHVLQGGSVSDYEGTSTRKECAPLLLRNIYQYAQKSGKGREVRVNDFYKAQSALQAFAQNKDVKNFKGTDKNIFPVPLLDSINFKTLEFDPSIQKK